MLKCNPRRAFGKKSKRKIYLDQSNRFQDLLTIYSLADTGVTTEPKTHTAEHSSEPERQMMSLPSEKKSKAIGGQSAGETEHSGREDASPHKQAEAVGKTWKETMNQYISRNIMLRFSIIITV